MKGGRLFLMLQIAPDCYSPSVLMPAFDGLLVSLLHLGFLLPLPDALYLPSLGIPGPKPIEIKGTSHMHI